MCRIYESRIEAMSKQSLAVCILIYFCKTLVPSLQGVHLAAWDPICAFLSRVWLLFLFRDGIRIQRNRDVPSPAIATFKIANRVAAIIVQSSGPNCLMMNFLEITLRATMIAAPPVTAPLMINRRGPRFSTLSIFRGRSPEKWIFSQGLNSPVRSAIGKFPSCFVAQSGVS